MSPRLSFFDDLDSPELCIVMDPIWFIENRSEIQEWLYIQGHGQDLGHGLFIVPIDLRPLFELRFQNFCG